MDGHTQIAMRFLEEHPDESARILEGLELSRSVALLGGSPPELAARVLARMAPGTAGSCLEALLSENAGPIADALAPEVAATLARRMESDPRSRLLDEMSPEAAERVARLLRHPVSSAGALMNPRILAIPHDISVAEAVEWIRESSEKATAYVYVVDRDQRLVGVLNYRDLLLADRDEPLSGVMHRPVSLRAGLAGAALLDHPAWRSYLALPVVDEAGVLVGALRAETLRQVQRGPGAPVQGVATALGMAEAFWIGLGRLLEGVVGAPPHDGSGGPGEGRSRVD